MDREAREEQMSKIGGKVSGRVWDAAAEVLRLAEKYRYLGKNFTFSFNGSLDEQVNAMLLALSDNLQTDAKNAAMQAIYDAQEDEDEITEYIRREQNDNDSTERFDWWCSRLKDSLGAWIAAGFACGLAAASILSEMKKHLKNPAGSGIWARSKTMPPAGFGKGLSGDIVAGLTLVSQGMINDAWIYESVLDAARSGAIGYTVHRGSTYDCGLCDSLCGYVHPLDDICLPAHPRCMCYIEPVFREG